MKQLRVEPLEMRLPLDSNGFLPICYAEDLPVTNDLLASENEIVPVMGPYQEEQQSGLPDWFGRAIALAEDNSANLLPAESGSSSSIQTRDASSSGLFARFDGIVGDATDVDHAGWMEVLTVDHGYSSLGNSSRDLALSELVLVTETSKASPRIARALLNGTVFPRFDLHFTSSFSGGREVYLDYQLENVVVTSYDLIAGRGPIPLETISLKFQEVDVVFRELDDDGQVQGQFPYNYRTTELQIAESLDLASSVAAKQREAELNQPHVGFAKFAGIVGDVTDSDHVDWINVISVDHGYTRLGEIRTGDLNFSEMVIVTENSVASPQVAQALLNGTNIRTLDLHFTTTIAGGGEVYLDYELSDVRVTSYDLIAGPNEIPLEAISVSFERLTVEHLERGRDGDIQSTTQYNWNIEESSPRSDLPLAASVANNLRGSESTRSSPAFARFDGIAGEATDADHVGWIEVLTVDHGYSSFGPSAEEPTLSELVLVAETSKASPEIAQALLRGTVFPQLDLHFTSTFSGGREVYLEYTLENVVVSSYDLIAGRGEIPLEAISLKFQELDVVYKELDAAGQVQGQFSYNYRSTELQVTESLSLVSSVAAKLRESDPNQSSVAFAKFDGIDGDVTDVDHVDWINVVSVDHGYNRQGEVRTGDLNLSELVIVTEHSKASPRIADALLKGRIIRTLDLHFTTTIDVGRQVYLRYRISDVRVASYDLIASPAGIPFEAISVTFEKLTVEYIEHDKEGNVQATTQYNWNVQDPSSRSELPLAVSLAKNLRNSEVVRSSPAFARFDGIAGDVTEVNHVGWMEVLTVDHGYWSLGTPTHDPNLSELVFVTETSQASLDLADALTKGTVFPQFDLHFTTVISGGREVFLYYQLENVVVTSYDFIAGRGDAVPLETISIKFEELEVVHRELSPEGELQGTVSHNYRLSDPQIASDLSLAASVAASLRNADTAPFGPTFARFAGIQGDVTDVSHRGWINVLSVDHNYTRLGDIRSGSVTTSELVMVIEPSKASPAIADAALKGRVFETLDLHFAMTSTIGPEVFLAYELSDVRISSYDLSSGPNGTIQEVISIEFDSLDSSRPSLNPRVDSVTINDGQSQRSMVDQLSIEFSELVTHEASALEVTSKDRPDVPIQIDVQWEVFNGSSTALVTFPGNPNSLPDGEYLLKIDGSTIRSVASDRMLDGNRDGNPGGVFQFGEVAADGFFRLFGDSDGDGDVDGQDYGRFGSSFLMVASDSGYRSMFDWDRDGDVDGQDYGQFGTNFLTSLGG